MVDKTITRRFCASDANKRKGKTDEQSAANLC